MALPPGVVLMQKQVDMEGVQLGQEANKVLQAAAEPIHRPRHHHVEFALSGIPKEPIKLGPPTATTKLVSPSQSLTEDLTCAFLMHP